MQGVYRPSHRSIKIGPAQYNPGGALAVGEDNTLMYANCDQFLLESKPYPSGGRVETVEETRAGHGTDPVPVCLSVYGTF